MAAETSSVRLDRGACSSFRAASTGGRARSPSSGPRRTRRDSASSTRRTRPKGDVHVRHRRLGRDPGPEQPRPQRDLRRSGWTARSRCPSIGDVMVAGLTPEQVKHKLESKIAVYMKDASITVTPIATSSKRFYVAASNPLTGGLHRQAVPYRGDTDALRGLGGDREPVVLARRRRAHQGDPSRSAPSRREGHQHPRDADVRILGRQHPDQAERHRLRSAHAVGPGQPADGRRSPRRSRACSTLTGAYYQSQLRRGHRHGGRRATDSGAATATAAAGAWAAASAESSHREASDDARGRLMNAELKQQQGPGARRLRQRRHGGASGTWSSRSSLFSAAGFGVAFLVPKEYQALDRGRSSRTRTRWSRPCSRRRVLDPAQAPAHDDLDRT